MAGIRRDMLLALRRATSFRCDHLRLLASKPEEKQRKPQNSYKEEQGEREEKHMIHLYKNKGQHILTNSWVLDAIVSNAGVRPTDTVLEIGPGTGNLTVKLLESARRVVAVEVDPRMIEILRSRVARLRLEDRLTVIQQDALKTQFPDFDLCVSNIPYGISSPLVAKLFFGHNKYHFRSATLLLQKEFTRRLLADPGDSEFNRLAVNVKLVATVDLLMDVSKRNFVPIPKVDSSVVTIRPRQEIPSIDLEEWWAFTLLCFGKKNKTLGAIFRQKKKLMELMNKFQKSIGAQGKNAGQPTGDSINEEKWKDLAEISLFKEKIVGILKVGGFEERRPSKLSHDELLHLLSLFNHAGVFFRQ